MMTAPSPPPEQPEAGDDVLQAALARWEVIARFAWAACTAQGRGVVLVDRDDLLAGGGGGPADAAPGLPLSFVPATHVPRGDDFAGVIATYDPRRQVALLVGGADGEQLLVLEPAGDARPAPPDC